jgi:hypothetical protein
VTRPGLVLALVVFTACGREQPTVAPIGESSSPQPPSPNRTYRIDADGRTTIDIGASLLRIKATTAAAAGAITLDPRDLAATRGEVKIDLVTLRSRTFGNAQSDDALATGARAWLEVAVEDRIDEKMRWATFRIRSIEDLDPSRDALSIPPLSGGGDVRRSVTLTARGDLLVHGRSASQTVKLRAELAWPPGAERGMPSAIAIQTIEPMEVALAEHAIVPRDAFGKETPEAAHLFGTKVGSVARVGLDLSAR